MSKMNFTLCGRALKRRWHSWCQYIWFSKTIRQSVEINHVLILPLPDFCSNEQVAGVNSFIIMFAANCSGVVSSATSSKGSHSFVNLSCWDDKLSITLGMSMIDMPKSAGASLTTVSDRPMWLTLTALNLCSNYFGRDGVCAR